MTTVSRRLEDERALEAARRPRSDLLEEEATGPDRWGQTFGPFRRWERRIESSGAGWVETTEYALDVPGIGRLLDRGFRFAVLDPDRTPRRRWYWPADVVGRETTRLMTALAAFSVITGFLGSMAAQTFTFAADEFDVDSSGQADMLALIRVGVLISTLLVWRADRRGRRPLLIAFAVGAVVFTMLGSVVPSFALLGVTQAIARGFTTGLIMLVMLAATEQVPAGSRSFAVSLLVLCAALGAGGVSWLLPLADSGESAWRIIYAVAGIWFVGVFYAAKICPETERFTTNDEVASPGRIDRRRFLLLATTIFMGAMFVSPASQLRNEYLRETAGFDATDILWFNVIIFTPVGLAMIPSALAADRYGRRLVGSLTLAAGSIMAAISFQTVGAMLWLVTFIGSWVGAGSYPALRTYQTELFPTRARARVGGWFDLVAVTGSATGLVVVGRLADRWDDLGTAIGALVVLPLTYAVVVAFFYPETAGRELEDFNPEDRAPAT